MRRKFFLLSAILLSVMMFSVTILAQQNFTVSLIGAQEVPPVNTSGRGTCMVTLNTAETLITISCTYSGLTSPANAAHIHNNGPVGVNGPVRFPLNPVSGTSGTIGPLPIPVTPADVADLRAKRLYVNIHTPNFPGGEIRGQIKIASTPFDFDGDGRTDIRVFRPSANTFYTLNSINNSLSVNFFAGTSTVNNASDDYDGDGRGDLVTFVFSGTDRIWRILQTATNTVREVRWGLSTDITMPADYDGDGKTDIAVMRRSTGIWYIIQSSDNQTRGEIFGLPNDIPVAGDFDKDGKSDLTVVRGGNPNGLAWFTRRSSDSSVQTVFWGGAPAPGADFIAFFPQIDIDGDGRQDHMVFRDPNINETGDPITYYILRSSNNQPFVLQWGIDTDARLFGDYDGDGKTDLVARRNVGGQYVWYIYQSSNGQGRAVSFGMTNDQ
ncbi:MAG: CHRD domain-containing protein [Acidobacteria bacterium]|nr:CHRD domain-containing protein [Acidobacteriota bacterium]MCA1636966.1 CHRD domain-containing protein [Acidobacteriota bacterium]